MRNTITLERQGYVWMADMSDAPNASEIRRLFGGLYIPLPFMTDAEPEHVRSRIAALNPGVNVVLRAEER